MSRRSERLGHMLRDELAQLLQHHLRDPRLSGVISLTQVSLSADLKHALVFVSILKEEQREEAMDALNTASGFLRHQLSLRLPWRRIPELHFRQDDSLERGFRILELMKRVTPS